MFWLRARPLLAHRTVISESRVLRTVAWEMPALVLAFPWGTSNNSESTTMARHCQRAGASVAVVLALACALAPVSAPAQEGDVENGGEVFKKCRACHDVGPQAKNKVGPVLNGIIGRPAG